MPGKENLDPAWDIADHILVVSADVVDAIYHPSLESNSECSGEVYMVGLGDQPPEKTTEEIQW
jgi:hypothetical protein